MNRRTAIARGLVALGGGLSFAACSPRRLTQPEAPIPRRLMLPPVQVEEHRLIRTVAGLRPYRPAGFRLESETVGDKLVVHNYGHGGAGVTLSWGTARLAVDIALRSESREAAVIGCGAVGLATARLLQDRGFRVRIYARDLPPNTTSNLAGALWAPFGVGDAALRDRPFSSTLAAASRFSHRYFQALVGARYGVRWLPLYMLGESSSAVIPWTWQLTPELFKPVALEPDEHPFPHPGVVRFFVMMIEPDTYLRTVLQDFRLVGGEVVVSSFDAREQILALPEPIVVNCTGLGARTLFGDTTMLPARGQLAFLVPQPEIEYLYLAGPYYMFPRSDGILLGGTFEPGDWSTEPVAATTTRILDGNRAIAQSLRLSVPAIRMG